MGLIPEWGKIWEGKVESGGCVCLCTYASIHQTSLPALRGRKHLSFDPLLAVIDFYKSSE